jgi:2-polyprenyl-3-methyl-5-hydroxy-6-metoxy-1,4-benzoquinol methylase
MTTTTRDFGAILESEQAYFDREAAGIDDSELMIAPDQMRRYREARARSTNIPKDTLFSMLQPLAGKRVLEYGCGMGEDACHCADCGAKVWAFDLSPISIRKAQRRAELLGLSDRIEFSVRTAGSTGYAPGSFDVIFGSAILHHLHQHLDEIYAELNMLLAPGGVACFMEPVANSKTLLKLRHLTPVRCDATPDERQLYYSDFELMKRHGFSSVDYVHFYNLERLQRVLGGRSARMLRRVDYYAQRLLPFLKRYYGILLVVARRDQ